MSKLQTCSEPSNIHLKREITQIRKVAYALRDPDMRATSFRSPLGTSRSIIAYQKRSDSLRIDPEFPPRIIGDNNEKHIGVQTTLISSMAPFSNCNSDGNNNSEDVEYPVSSATRSPNDSLCDAYSVGTSSAFSVLQKGANLVLSGTPSGIKRTGRKVKGHVHLMPRRTTKKNTVLRRNSHRPGALSQNDSAGNSVNVEESFRTGSLRQSSAVLPILLRQKKTSQQDSSKLLREATEEDSTDTNSASSLLTSSCCWYKNGGSSIIGSWDDTATSLNDGGCHDNDQLDFPGSHGCGIPCYWSKRTPRHRGMYDRCYSPSLSDTFRRKGSSILSGSWSAYNGRHHPSSPGSKKRRETAKFTHDALPLPASSCDGKRESSGGTGYGNDEVFTNFGELKLEASSRLDGRRWSTYRSKEGSDCAALTVDQEEDSLAENCGSLSQKYKPMFFDEIIGQKIVVRSLVNAVQRRRIAPVYLFQGPRGTGKTSLARIFAAALNCLAIKDIKPCCICKRCRSIISGKSKDVWEVDGTDRNGIYNIRCILKNFLLQPLVPSVSSSYKVFIIDECQLLSSKTWLDFLKFIEEQMRGVVFVFITTDLDNVPCAIQSRCQKYRFSKIKDCNISARLHKISTLENLDVESDAIDLIALNAGGSLRDAETMLDQLSSLGKRITTALVSELVGVVSDKKLLDLLELAMSSDTVETVKRTRELLDSGIDPLVLISQLARLIMDIIAGTYKSTGSRHSESSSSEQTLHGGEMEKLKHALKLLSEAKTQLRASSEQSTWFTAMILQLGSVPSPEISHPGNCLRHSYKTTEEDHFYKSGEYSCKETPRPKYVATHEFPFPESTLDEISHLQNNIRIQSNKFNFRLGLPRSDEINNGACSNPLPGIDETTPAYLSRLEKLHIIWDQCIERCHSKTLRFLLHSHGKLLSISEAEGVLLSYVGFVDKYIKSRVERYLSSITNSMEIILRRNVEVRLILLPNGKELLDFHCLLGTSGLSRKGEAFAIVKENRTVLDDCIEDELQQKTLKVIDRSPLSTQLSVQLSEGKQELPAQRVEAIITEQILDTAWLQTNNKSLASREDTVRVGDQVERALDSRHWVVEPNNKLKGLKVNDKNAMQNDTIRSHHPMSPSLLHCTSKESLANNSGSGKGCCRSIFCFNARSCRRKQ
ncbi:hypothetical protein MLD38_016603 [Melastoma candidum]|uniref:Uncharacterized protein n=1 Tax=Melastoma candidum TaxID=119954 RepID=A0ACB9QRY5_9MYRT|nr:hypothetical protein MLD38_016603 [Melastoma candidum]